MARYDRGSSQPKQPLRPPEVIMFRHGGRSVPCSGAFSRVCLVFGGRARLRSRGSSRGSIAALPVGAWWRPVFAGPGPARGLLRAGLRRSGPRASAWRSLSAASERAWLPFALRADTRPWLPGVPGFPGFPDSQGRRRRSARSGKTNGGRSGAGSGAGSRGSDHRGSPRSGAFWRSIGGDRPWFALQKWDEIDRTRERARRRARARCGPPWCHPIGTNARSVESEVMHALAQRRVIPASASHGKCLPTGINSDYIPSRLSEGRRESGLMPGELR